MIPEKSPVNTYSGNGATKTFDFNFYIENESQLVVYHTDKDGVQVKLTLGTDYSINAIGNENGSYVTFPIAGSSYSILKGESSAGAGDAEKISLCLNLKISQESEYGTSGALNLQSLEYSLDYLTRLIQIQARLAERSIKVQEGSANSPDELINEINTKVLAAQGYATTAEEQSIIATNQAVIAEDHAADAEVSYNNTVTKYNETATLVTTEKTNIQNLSNTNQAAISSLGGSVKTEIQSLGIFMENDRLFYFDSDGIKHEFRNDYGGLAPMNVKHREIKKVTGGFNLSWVDPDDSIYKDNIYCNWGGTLVVRKEGSYPESPFDGDIVTNSTVRNTYSDTPFFDSVDNTKNYKYRAFPYSINKVYNLSDNNKFGVWIYSYCRKILESVPADKVVGYGTNEVYLDSYMKYSADTFVYGDWEDAPFLQKDRLAPCMVYNGDSVNNGQVAYFLNENDYTKKEDGTASDIANTAQPLNAMMRFKLMYCRRRVINGDEYVDISNEQVNSDYKPYGGFVKADGTLREYIYLPIYKGGLVSGKNRSMSGLTPMSGYTAPQERTYSQANGSGWDMVTYADRQMVEDLALLMFGTTDLQSALGQGKSNGGSTVADCLVSGTMNTKGKFWGSTSTAVGVKLFGMENWYGSQWDRILGHVLVNGVQKVKLTKGTQDGSTVTDFNLTGDGYVALSTLAAPSGTSGGYISKSQAVAGIGNFPVVASGSSSTYECDGFWFNNSGTMVAFRGGSSTDGSFCGLFTCSLDSVASSAGWYVGASISYKPL